MTNKLCTCLQCVILSCAGLCVPQISFAQTGTDSVQDFVKDPSPSPVIISSPNAQNIGETLLSGQKHIRMMQIPVTGTKSDDAGARESAEKSAENPAENGASGETPRLNNPFSQEKSALPQPLKTSSEAHILAYLQDLEQSAKESYENRQFDNALSIYREYEVQMRNAGYDMIQIDLLHNQMLAALKAEKLGYAIACLQQIELIAPSEENRLRLSALRSLVEYKISQDDPKAVFIRGQDDKFQMWQRVHRYSRPQIYGIVLVIWASLFILIGIAYAVQYASNRDPKRIIFSIVPLWFGLLGMMVIVIAEHQSTKDLRYAVLLDNTSLRADISPNPSHIDDPGFAEGLIVMILTQNEKWSHIRRADGVSAWVSNSDIYTLRSVDQSTMNLGIKAYRDSRNEAPDALF